LREKDGAYLGSNIQTWRDKLQCKNYRGISLLCTGYKILTAVFNIILINTLNIKLENTKQDLEQENRLQIKFLQFKIYWKKAWEHNVEIHQIFVDFQKAYDSIRRDKLYAIMADFGIPNKLIRQTKATVENSTY